MYIGAFNSMETLSWLTQSRRSICNPLQRYPDNVRYSEETRLRSVSKSFLAAAYPRFESPDTSKDPKREARARAPVYFGNRYYCRLPRASPSLLAFSVFARLRASVNLHRHALNCIRAYIASYTRKPSTTRPRICSHFSLRRPVKARNLDDELKSIGNCEI